MQSCEFSRGLLKLIVDVKEADVPGATFCYTNAENENKSNKPPNKTKQADDESCSTVGTILIQ